MFTISHNASIKFTSKHCGKLFKSVLIWCNGECSSCGQLQGLSQLWFWHHWISVSLQAVVSTTSIQCQRVPRFFMSAVVLSFQLLINHPVVFFLSFGFLHSYSIGILPSLAPFSWILLTCLLLFTCNCVKSRFVCLKFRFSSCYCSGRVKR